MIPSPLSSSLLDADGEHEELEAWAARVTGCSGARFFSGAQARIAPVVGHTAHRLRGYKYREVSYGVRQLLRTGSTYRISASQTPAWVRRSRAAFAAPCTRTRHWFPSAEAII